MGSKTKEIRKKDLYVEQSDSLPQIKYHTTPAGMRLVNTSEKLIQEKKLESTKLTFSKRDFFDILESKTAGKYDKLKKTCKELLKSYVSLKTSTGWKMFPLFYDIEFIEVKEEVIVHFHDFIKQNLLNIRKNINVEEALNSITEFKSKYTIKFYEIFKENLLSQESAGNVSMGLTELKAILGLEEDEYSKYNDLKRRIILTAQKEINSSSDIYFDFEEEKLDRKVKAIKFSIKNKADDTDNINSSTENEDKEITKELESKS